jgi:hypothetical protein
MDCARESHHAFTAKTLQRYLNPHATVKSIYGNSVAAAIEVAVNYEALTQMHECSDPMFRESSVPLPCDIFGEKDITGAEGFDGAIADTNVY